jgi:acyl-CoA thioester hydrolase
MSAIFSTPIRVYYEDTDAARVVYYANYLKFMERARTEWLRSLGYEQGELLSRENIIFVVRSVKLDYLKPAHLNDLLHATVQVLKSGHASMTFAQQIRRDDVVLCDGEVKAVCLDATALATRRLPEPLRTAMIQGVMA